MKTLDEQLNDAALACAEMDKRAKTEPISLVQRLGPYVLWNNLLLLKAQQQIENEKERYIRTRTSDR